MFTKLMKLKIRLAIWLLKDVRKSVVIEDEFDLSPFAVNWVKPGRRVMK